MALKRKKNSHDQESHQFKYSSKLEMPGFRLKRPLMTKRAREVSRAGEPPGATVDAQSEAPGRSGSLVVIVVIHILKIHNKLESAEPFMEVVCKELDPTGELLRVRHHPELVQFNYKQEK